MPSTANGSEKDAPGISARVIGLRTLTPSAEPPVTAYKRVPDSADSTKVTPAVPVDVFASSTPALLNTYSVSPEVTYSRPKPSSMDVGANGVLIKLLSARVIKSRWDSPVVVPAAATHRLAPSTAASV